MGLDGGGRRGRGHKEGKLNTQTYRKTDRRTKTGHDQDIEL